MTVLVFDIEADNLLPFVSTIWVVCTRVVETGEEQSFRERDEFVDYVGCLEPSVVVGHHHIGFDLPALRKVWGIPYTVGRNDTWMGYPVEFVDTFHLSMYLNPDRKPGHGLDDWGATLGFPKGSHSDWSRYTPEMEAYCRQDVAVTSRVYQSLMRELEEKCG